MRRLILAGAFVATVWAANYAVNHWGLVSVGFGLMAPAGVYFAGLGFLLRDALQEAAGRVWVVGAILAGALLSYLLGGGGMISGGLVPLAAASAAAFLVSELADFAVYTPLRERTLGGAVGFSQIVGAGLDSLLFLYLAFGPDGLAFWRGQFVGKTLMVLPVVVLLLVARRRASPVTA
jgi:uncharacterized PurR-regulated membrane protein YhhQ (DUF165 family)